VRLGARLGSSRLVNIYAVVNLTVVDLKKEAALTLMDNKYDKEVNKPFCWAAFESNKSILV